MAQPNAIRNKNRHAVYLVSITNCYKPIGPVAPPDPALGLANRGHNALPTQLIAQATYTCNPTYAHIPSQDRLGAGAKRRRKNLKTTNSKERNKY
jgi:hypothetical protein